MPYLKLGRKKELLTEPKRANTDGDWNYLYTVAFLKEFISRPEYATIARIRKSVHDPRKVKGTDDVDDFLIVQGVSALDRQTARELAFAEFYERVGKLYEKLARERNGDVQEYVDAIAVIANKFQTAEA